MIKDSHWDIDRFLGVLYFLSYARFFLVFFRGFKLQIREGLLAGTVQNSQSQKEAADGVLTKYLPSA